MPRNHFAHSSDTFDLLKVSLKWHILTFDAWGHGLHERPRGPHFKRCLINKVNFLIKIYIISISVSLILSSCLFTMYRSCSKIIINIICKNTIKKNKIKTTFFSQLNHCYCWSLFQRSRRWRILSLRDIGCQKSAGSSSGFGRLILIRVSINFNLQYFAEFLSIELIEEDVNDGIDEGMWPTQKVHSYM